MNQTIFSVTRHLEKFEFNTGVSDLMKANNEISKYLNENSTVSKETKDFVFNTMCNLLYPFSPHISSEIYNLFQERYLYLKMANLMNQIYQILLMSL